MIAIFARVARQIRQFRKLILVVFSDGNLVKGSGRDGRIMLPRIVIVDRLFGLSLLGPNLLEALVDIASSGWRCSS